MHKALILMLAVAAVATPALCADYVVLIQSGVNIRTAPDTSSIVVGEASKGSLYHYSGEVGDWHEITMFTGEKRYISKALSAALDENQILPGHNLHVTIPHEISRAMRLKITRAKERAGREAEEIVPAGLDQDRNSRYRAILEDRYIMLIFRNHEVQPALYYGL
jgi:hypothetical protein